MKKHTQQLWISQGHVPWLMQYMATEHALGGVAEQPANPGADEEGSVENDEGAEGDSAVAESPIQWDWKTNDGYCAVVDGKVARCAISTFTEAKFNVACAVHKYNTTFANASQEEITQACHDYLQQYLKSLV